MPTTGQTLASAVAKRMGNVSLSAYGDLIVDGLNDSVEFIANKFIKRISGQESRASYTIPAGSTNPQVIPLTNWANDIWIPLQFYDLTNERRIAYRDVLTVEQDTSTAGSTQPNQYALWGDSLYISPNLSASLQVRLYYLSNAARFTWDGATVGGSSPFPTQFDEGLVWGAHYRSVIAVNPELVQVGIALYERWENNLVTANMAHLATNPSTLGVRIT